MTNHRTNDFWGNGLSLPFSCCGDQQRLWPHTRIRQFTQSRIHSFIWKKNRNRKAVFSISSQSFCLSVSLINTKKVWKLHWIEKVIELENSNRSFLRTYKFYSIFFVLILLVSFGLWILCGCLESLIGNEVKRNRSRG